MTISRPDQAPGTGFNIGINDIFSILLERIWIVILCTVVGGIVGYAQLMRSPKIYATQVKLLVTSPKQVVNIQKVSSEDERNITSMQTNIEQLRAKPLAERVVKKLNLANDPEFILGFPPGTKLTPDAAADQLQGMISAAIVSNANVIVVTVEHRSPAMAQKLANTIADEFINKNIEDHSQVSKQALHLLIEQAEQVQGKVAQSENEQQQYQEKNKGEGVVLEDREFEDLNTRFNEIRKNRLVMEGDFKVVQAMGAQYDVDRLLVLSSIKNDPGVESLGFRISKQQEQIDAVSKRLRDDHPQMIQARRELSLLQASLTTAAVQAAQGLRNRYEAAFNQEKQLEEIVLQRKEKKMQFDAIARKADMDRGMFNSLQQRIKETEVLKALNADDIKILENADYPYVPVKPSAKKMILAAVGGGGLLGVLLAFGLNLLDNSIKTPDQIETNLHLPTLSVVAESPTVKSSHSDKFHGDMSPAVRESFRSLVVSLKLLGRRGDGKSFLFTSALPAEGKTFCSFHCSLQFAAQGHRVVVVDADLRKPLLHKLVPNARLENGLSDILAEQISVDDAIQETNLENLFFISAGSRSPNPPKLLASTLFSEVVAQLGKKFDYIIIDSAPVNAVADTLLIAPHVQRVCLIARASSTPERAVIRAIQALFSSAEKQPSGVVLNRYKRRRGLYYYYNYSYHKSYGYYGAYGEEKKDGQNEASG